MLNYIGEKYGIDLTNVPVQSPTSAGDYPGKPEYSTAAIKIDFDYKPFKKEGYRPIKIVEDTINAPSERITGDDDIKDVFDSLTSGDGR